MSDFTDFVYLELPKRSVTIKGSAEATGDPNDSLLAKVQNAPIGTFYLQDDAIPRVYWYRSDVGSDSWRLIGSGGSGNTTYHRAFLITDWIAGAGIWYIEFTHNLDTEYTNVEVRDGNNTTFVDVITINNNKTRIQIPSDFRFDGSIAII